MRPEKIFSAGKHGFLTESDVNDSAILAEEILKIISQDTEKEMQKIEKIKIVADVFIKKHGTKVVCGGPNIASATIEVIENAKSNTNALKIIYSLAEMHIWSKDVLQDKPKDQIKIPDIFLEVEKKFPGIMKPFLS